MEWGILLRRLRKCASPSGFVNTPAPPFENMLLTGRGGGGEVLGCRTPFLNKYGGAPQWHSVS